MKLYHERELLVAIDRLHGYENENYNQSGAQENRRNQVNQISLHQFVWIGRNYGSEQHANHNCNKISGDFEIQSDLTMMSL